MSGALDKISSTHFGTTTVEHFMPLERNGISGGGANGAVGLAVAGVGKIIYVTTFDRPEHPIMLGVYEKFQNLGIHLVSQKGFKTPISLYSTQKAIDDKTPDLPQFRGNNPDNLPASIAEVRALQTDAASMVGSPLQNKFTRDSFTDTRRLLADRDIPTVSNLNPRSPVDIEVTKLLLASSFANALGHRDIIHQLGEELSAEEAGRRMLTLAKESGSPISSKIISVTADEGSTVTAFFNPRGQVEVYRGPRAYRILDGKFDPAGAGDAYAAIFAAGLGLRGIKAHAKGLDLDTVASVVETASRGATDFLFAKNQDPRFNFLNDAIPWEPNDPLGYVKMVAGYTTAQPVG